MEAASAYRSLASERRALEDSLKQLKARMAETEAVFLGQMGDYLLAETEGIRVSRYLQNGSVDYPALLKEIMPNVDEATLNRFRRPSSERVKVTLQSQPAPAETCFYF
jgi:nicotinamide mononucleotide (NMN) deamidase PncC